MLKLTAHLRERHHLTADAVASMYALYAAYYESTSPDMFAADLSEKTHVILLYGSAGELCGFSTLSLWESVYEGRPFRVVFSGDTIIHHRHWGDQSLALAFCRFAGHAKAQLPDVPLYWFLISKGHRTYRYLHLFSQTYWPSYRDDTHPKLQPILAALARKKFGESYDPATSVIRFPSSRGHLRPNWAQVRENLKLRPEVEFFLKQNPGYAQGDELACITELREDNLRSVARRAFMLGYHGVTRWPHPDAA
jgi:hypothetical protein